MLALAATATFGFGYGLLTAGTNLLVAELGGMRSASLVSLLNFMWGVGAMTCPLLIAFALKHNRISLTLLGCAAFGVVMVIGLLLLRLARMKDLMRQISPKQQGRGLHCT